MSGELQSFDAEFLGDVRLAARSVLDDATEERMYQDGRAMETEEAVAYALEKDGP